MDNAIKLLLLIAKGLIDNQKNKEIEDFVGQQVIDWENFLGLIQYHELLPIAYILLKEKHGAIPPAIYKEIKSGYFFSLANNVLLWDQFSAITRAFNDHDITFVPLKGLSFIGDIYPDINYRSMVDIDILVKEENLKSVEDILLNIGYNKYLEGLKEVYWRKRQCHIAFVKNLSHSQHILVEVHWGLDFKRIKQPILPELWKRTEEKDIEENCIRFLSCEDAIFSLALHKRRFGNILALKGVCDIACLINKFKSTLDWDYLLKWSRASNIKTTLYFSLIQTKLISADLIPESFLEKLGIPLWKRKAIDNFVVRNTLSPDNPLRDIYLKAHFLLYDSLWEPINYILNIPQEQFAKFYDFSPYAERTSLLYRMRWLYMPYRYMVNMSQKLTLRERRSNEG